MRKRGSRGVGGKLILALTLLFFYAPIVYIIVFSFNDSRSLTRFGGFSLRWYEKMFADSAMMEAVMYTVLVAVIATAVSTVVGTVGREVGKSIFGKFGSFGKLLGGNLGASLGRNLLGILFKK